MAHHCRRLSKALILQVIPLTDRNKIYFLSDFVQDQVRLFAFVRRDGLLMTRASVLSSPAATVTATPFQWQTLREK